MISKQKVCDTIKNRQIVKFYYEGHLRIVEPHLVGMLKNGSIVLSAYRVGGYSESESEPPWRSYKLEKITRWNPTEETFAGTRKLYNRNNTRMSNIYCRL